MNATEASTDKLVSDLKRIVTDSEDLLHATKDAAGDKAHEMRQRLTATLESAKQACHRLEEKAREAARAADRTIRAHPYESIGVAFGVGLLIGGLVMKRK